MKLREDQKETAHAMGQTFDREKAEMACMFSGSSNVSQRQLSALASYWRRYVRKPHKTEDTS